MGLTALIATTEFIDILERKKEKFAAFSARFPHPDRPCRPL
jgi:hypothetical protein